MANEIEVIVLSLTDKNDLNGLISPKNKNNAEISFKMLQRILKENEKLDRHIQKFELGGLGNPLLHKKIDKTLELFKKFNLSLNIITNGLNLKDIIACFDNALLDGTRFSVYLDSFDEEKNDRLNEKKSFKRTIESLEYLEARELKYNIQMRLCSQNYKEIENMLEVAKFYKCGFLILTEIFPMVQNRNLLLLDEMKLQAINLIDELKISGEPVIKAIHFERPEANCTYLRKRRLFINSKGNLAFCHFLSWLTNTEICDTENENLEKLIEMNNKIRDNFMKRKQKEIITWELPRKTASPCSYCLHYFGVNKKW
jgi:MoaA/NifB/PqqE/SkfB family radical SAM enzyme